MILFNESKQARVVNGRVTRAESLSHTPGNLSGKVKNPEWTTGHKELLHLCIQCDHGPAAFPQMLLLGEACGHPEVAVPQMDEAKKGYKGGLWEKL